MDMRLWAILSVFVLAIIIAVIVFAMAKKKKTPPDYYAFFAMGLVWLVIGLAMNNTGLVLLGLLFSMIGLINKNKWKKNKQTWDKLNKKEKMFRSIVVIVLFVLVLLSVVFLVLTNKGII